MEFYRYPSLFERHNSLIILKKIDFQMTQDLWLEKVEGLTNQDLMIIHFAEFYEKGG